MTSADTFDATIHMLIDAPEDGIVEQHAWVRVTTITPDPENAQAKLEREFPPSEQGEGGEGMSYRYVEQVWLKPVHHYVDYATWEGCEAGDDGSTLYWMFELVSADDGD